MPWPPRTPAGQGRSGPIGAAASAAGRTRTGGATNMGTVMIENKAGPAVGFYVDVMRRLAAERNPGRRAALHRGAAEAAEQTALAGVHHYAHPGEIARWRRLAQRHRAAAPAAPRRNETTEQPAPAPVPEPRPAKSALRARMSQR